jgi:uncharacterized membrane protein YraQ (UPF0718 family)
MFQIFTILADLAIQLLGLQPNTHLAKSLHFFVEDTTKIFFLLIVMIYSISFLRASLKVEVVRDYLKKKNRFLGYLSGSMFGAITPFCSCSSIPLFLGFTTARIPIGVTMSFLITSPMINEVAIVLLGSLLGWKFTISYVIIGLLVGMTGGFLLDSLKAEKYLQDFIKAAVTNQPQPNQVIGQQEVPESLSRKERHEFAKKELKDIFGRVWKWVIIGVGAGALLHGFVPEEWVTETLGAGQWWSVPIAVVLGIPLYSNASGMIPVMESLLIKGLPVGTTLAFSMSTIAASFPEFVLLKQVMQWKLLAMLFIILLVNFTLVGWFFNAFWGTM